MCQSVAFPEPQSAIYITERLIEISLKEDKIEPFIHWADGKWADQLIKSVHSTAYATDPNILVGMGVFHFVYSVYTLKF